MQFGAERLGLRTAAAEAGEHNEEILGPLEGGAPPQSAAKR